MSLAGLSSYACYYGLNRLDDLAAFDLVILQPEHYPAAQVSFLCARATLPIAYLAIGEEPPRQPPAAWALRDAETGQAVQNPEWQTDLIDCRSPAWQAHLLEERIPAITARGFRGLFLDTLDVADRHPETRPGVLQLLRSIRARYPQLALIADRGFSLLDEIQNLLDGFLFEAFTTRSVGGGYAPWEAAELAWTAQQAARLLTLDRQLPLFALDYAAPADRALHSLARQRARAYGFLPYVTTRALDWLP